MVNVGISHLHGSTQAKSYDIWVIGIVISVGGSYFGWADGLQRGFGSCLLSLAFTGTAYFAFVLSSCELFSALPFSGGMFGVARCTVGLFPGFLIGCSEALEYILITSMSVSACGSLFCALFSLSKLFLVVAFFAVYAISIAAQSLGPMFFWRFNNFIATSCILVITLYCLGNVRNMNFKMNVMDSDWFEQGISGFLYVLPTSSWFFIGVESIVFASNMVESPKLEIPKGYISCVLTLFVIGVCVIFVGCSLPQGVNELEQLNPYFPLNTGFLHIFHGTKMSSYVNSMSLLATFGASHGMIFATGKLLHALAESGLLPSLFQGKTAAKATIYGALISFSICTLTAFSPAYSSVVFNVCVLSGYSSYCVHCIGYVYVRTRFSSLDRSFRSPLGMFGAFYAGGIFFLAIVSLVFLQQDNHKAFLSQLLVWFIMAFYYLHTARKKQRFSLEEQKNLFVAHVIRHNIRLRRQRTPAPPFSSVVTSLRRLRLGSTSTVQRIPHNEVNVRSRVVYILGLQH